MYSQASEHMNSTNSPISSGSPSRFIGTSATARVMKSGGVLAAAWDYRTRGAVARELIALLTRSGRYRGTIEELTQVWRDPPSALPLLYIIGLMLAAPKKVERFSGAATVELRRDRRQGRRGAIPIVERCLQRWERAVRLCVAMAVARDVANSLRRTRGKCGRGRSTTRSTRCGRWRPSSS